MNVKAFALVVTNQYEALYTPCQILLTKPLDSGALKSLLDLARSTTNSDVRSRSMLICTLNPILRDDLVAYTRCLTALEASYRGQSFIASAKPDALSESCLRCEGAGSGYRSCPSCSGSGKCKTCKGKGQITWVQINGPSRTEDCSTCKGGGSCKQCDGKEKIQIKCANCQGSGQSISKTKARDAYYQVLKETSSFCYQMLHPEIDHINKAVDAAKNQNIDEAVKTLENIIELYPQAENIKQAKDMLSVFLKKQQTAKENEERMKVIAKANEEKRKALEIETAQRLLVKQQQEFKVISETTDVPKAISMSKTFIERYPNSPLSSEAKALLAKLQEKQKLINSSGL